MIDQLHFETYGIVGEGRWFHLYECPHITEGEFPICLAICIGPHHNLLLCRHCWQQVKGLAAEEILQNEFQHLASGLKPVIVHRLLNPDEPLSDAELIMQLQEDFEQKPMQPEKAGQGDVE